MTKRVARKGASLAEYGITTGLIATVSIGAVISAGDTISSSFDSSVRGIANGSAQVFSSPDPVDPCYDASNAGTVGQGDWADCAGMYIIDQSEFDTIISGSSGGNGSYAVSSGGDTYTLGNSAYNIFTGQLTSMSGAFRNTSFNDDIGYLDVSNVTDFSNAFNSNSIFNRDISSWDTSSATDFSGMFILASNFNQPIGSWNVDNVTTMVDMLNSTSFNQPLSNWNVDNVTDMRGLFASTPFNQDISGWETGNVTNMRSLFFQTPFNQNISGWDVSKVENFARTFEAPDFNQDISSWVTTSATSMFQMFYNNGSFNQNLSGWDVGGVTDCRFFDTNASAWSNPKPGFPPGCS